MVPLGDNVMDMRLALDCYRAGYEAGLQQRLLVSSQDFKAAYQCFAEVFPHLVPPPEGVRFVFRSLFVDGFRSGLRGDV
jgi:hypothetical protein